MRERSDKLNLISYLTSWFNIVLCGCQMWSFSANSFSATTLSFDMMKIFVRHDVNENVHTPMLPTFSLSPPIYLPHRHFVLLRFRDNSGRILLGIDPENLADLQTHPLIQLTRGCDSELHDLGQDFIILRIMNFVRVWMMMFPEWCESSVTYSVKWTT
jgi:hypothetical protein